MGMVAESFVFLLAWSWHTAHLLLSVVCPFEHSLEELWKFLNHKVIAPGRQLVSLPCAYLERAEEEESATEEKREVSRFDTCFLPVWADELSVEILVNVHGLLEWDEWVLLVCVLHEEARVALDLFPFCANAITSLGEVADQELCPSSLCMKKRNESGLAQTRTLTHTLTYILTLVVWVRGRAGARERGREGERHRHRHRHRHVHTYVHTYIRTYVHMERGSEGERERGTDTATDTDTGTGTGTGTHTHTHTHTHTRGRGAFSRLARWMGARRNRI